MSTPEWDGERIDGRPVARCFECGTLHYAEDIEYIGEAALGGPNFTYRMGDRVVAEHFLSAAGEPAALDEPTLTRILGELAPVIGGDLLNEGVPYRVGLASAILARLEKGSDDV